MDSPGADEFAYDGDMPLYMIERHFVEKVDLTSERIKLIEEINVDVGVSWIITLLTQDGQTSFCLYEAPSPEAIREAAQRSGIPADAIIEVHRAYG
jgi:hypothetical protein